MENQTPRNGCTLHENLMSLPFQFHMLHDWISKTLIVVYNHHHVDFGKISGVRLDETRKDSHLLACLQSDTLL